jgi:lipopolysaccharide biosynthesis regulator YciM
MDPTNEDYYLLLAEFLGTNNAVDPVVTVLESAAKNLPASAKVRSALGVGYLMQSRFDRAESAFQNVLQGRPADELAARLLADCYNRAQEWTKLEKASATLRTLEPGNALGWYYGALAEYQLIEAGAKDASLQKVREYVRTAVKLAPDDWRSRVLEGKLALRDSRPADAVAAFRRAVAANAEEPVPHYLLATALRQVGKVAESKAELEIFRNAQAAEKARKFRTLVVEIQRRESPGR